MLLNLRRLLMLCTLFAALPLRAHRHEYRVTYDGSRKAGSEICFYRGETATDAFSLFLTHPASTACLPADQIIDLPPGLFHVYARHKDGLVSAHREFTVYHGEAAPEQGYRLLDVPLTPAGLLDVREELKHLANDEWIGVWLSQTPTTLSSFRPLVAGESTIPVPGDTPFVAFTVRAGRPARVFAPMSISAGKTEVLVDPGLDASTSDVVVSVSADHHAVSGRDKQVPWPEIFIRNGDHAFRALFPLFLPLSAQNELVFIKGVPVGSAEFHVGGDYWLPRKEIVNARPGTTVISSPVTLTPAGVLDVTLKETVSALPACPGVSSATPAESDTVLTVARCNGMSSGAECVVVAERPLSEKMSLRFPGLEPGYYRASIGSNGLGGASNDVSVAAGETAHVGVALDSFSFSGHVTRAGKAVAAMLSFFTGEAASDETGAYVAHLAADPLTNVVEVQPCGGTALIPIVVPTRIARNTTFDIELPDTHMDVHVVDHSETAIPEAKVFYAIPRDLNDSKRGFRYCCQRATVDADGKVVFQGVPADTTLRVCATHPDFSQGCETAKIADHGSETITLRLERVATHHGKISNVAPGDVVFWVGSTGVTESAAVATDGSFSWRKEHLPPEYVVVASPMAPLFVRPIPNTEPSEEFAIARPMAVTRHIMVRLVGGKHDQRYDLGLWVGPFYVPRAVLAFHQDARQQPIALSPGSSAVLGDVVEDVGPVAIGAVADPCPAHRGDACLDPFVLPEYANAQHIAVEDGVISLRPF